MAEVNPPYVLHNVGATHTAEGFRMALSALTGGVRAASSLAARGGVNPHLGGGMAVTAQGSPSLALNVASGVAVVPGSEGTRQGVYVCVNDATKVVTMDAAHASLPRIDLVIARVFDSFYSGAANTWAIEKLTGTANSSPVAPALPANSVLLATVNRSAADDTIATGDITDNRTKMVAAGGVIPVHSTGKTSLLTQVGEGQVSVETDTGKIASVIGGAWAGATTVDVQIFTANGTWTKPSGARTVWVRCVGGGGASGGAPATGAGESSCGAGGQSGAYTEGWFAASSLSSTVAVTRGAGGAAGAAGTAGGAGGDSSFGAHLVSPGGAGGSIAAASSGPGGTSGGNATHVMTGTIQIAGEAGGGCMRVGTNAALGGSGGSNPLGAGGAGGSSPSGPAAVAGRGYGSGAGGAANAQSSSARVGAAGAAGIIIAVSFL